MSYLKDGAPLEPLPSREPKPNESAGKNGFLKSSFSILTEKRAAQEKLQKEAKKEPAIKHEDSFWDGGKASARDVKKVVEKWDPNIHMKGSERKDLAKEIVEHHISIKQKDVIKLEKETAREKSKDPDMKARIKEREDRNKEIKVLKKLIDKE